MAKCIDLVAGFFEAGKTTFVKKLIKNEVADYFDRVLIINCEYGMESYADIDVEGLEIKSVDIYRKEDFTQDRIKREIDIYRPDYVIIEYNGMWEISDVLSMKFGHGFYIRNLISLVDYKTFDSYISNMENVIVDKIENSDIVIINRPVYEEELDQKFRVIKSINRSCDIFTDDELFINDEPDIINGKMTRSDFEIVKFAALFLLFNMAVIGIKYIFLNFYRDSFQRIMGIFVSLLVQVLPFLLMGAIISSLIQVFVPAGRFNKIFAKTSPKSMFVALFAGVFFPVCDCAMVPVATSIVKKGYSVPVAITFLLASPAVNPIVIISTMYAFPNQPKMVLYRVLFGLLIALVAGMSLVGLELIYKKRSLACGEHENREYQVMDGEKDTHNYWSDRVIKDHINKYSISQAQSNRLRLKGKMRYLEAIVVHTKNEFFKIGFYLVIGAFLSAFLQVMVSKGVFLQMNKVNSISVIVMIVAAFFISICSTSNAFIARSFYNIMPLNSLLAFMVMGPMLDVTNLSVMLGTFKKGFVFKLIGVLVYISFIVFSLIGGGLKLV